MGNLCSFSEYPDSLHGHSGVGDSKVKKRHRVRLDAGALKEADERNILLDKWTHQDVQQLMRLFKQKAGDSGSMDKDAFVHVFQELRNLPDSVAQAAFNVFDQDKSGTIDFREFCTAVAICCLSSREEQVSFVFDLFDAKKSGSLSPQQVRLLLDTAVASMRRLSSGPGATQDDSWIHSAQSQLLESASDKKKLSKQEFQAWALENLDVTSLLDPFRVIPSAERQAKVAAAILNDWKELKIGETVYIVAVSWWEEWCIYAGIAVEEGVYKYGGSQLTAGETKSTAAVDPPVEQQPQPQQLRQSAGDEAVTNSSLIKPELRQLSYQYGERPGPIDNSSLCGTVNGAVKTNLMQGHTYVLLPTELWEQLHSWYGGGPVFARTVIPTSNMERCRMPRDPPKSEDSQQAMNGNSGIVRSPSISMAETEFYVPLDNTTARVEVHPLLLRMCAMDSRTGKPAVGQQTIDRSVSSQLNVAELTVQVCAEFKIKGGESRLWIKPRGEDWRLLDRLDDSSSSANCEAKDTSITLEEADIESGDLVMVEHNESGSIEWPRDAIQLRLANFREFEENSKLDAMDCEKKWYSATVVQVVRGENGAIEKLRVNFDGFASKYDEYFAPDSEKLQPLYTHTVPKKSHTQTAGRRAGTTSILGAAPRNGAVGLYNLGNTCFMNSTLQALSNTPLFRNYLINGTYDEELNTKNSQGTGGRLTSALAGLFKALWRDQESKPLRSLRPSTVKREISRWNPQFQGYDQQDAHELLISLLSGIHEDTNRVDPPAKPASTTKHSAETKVDTESKNAAESAVATSNARAGATNEGESTSKDSGTNDFRAAADTAWKKYLQTSRSIIVDLFTGQECRLMECSNCGHESRSFATQTCVSVSLTARFAFRVNLIRLPTAASGDDSAGAQTPRPWHQIVQYGVMNPQVGTVGDLKLGISSLCRIPANRLTISMVEEGLIKSFYSDSSQLRSIGEDKVLYAFEIASTFDEIAAHPKCETVQPAGTSPAAAESPRGVTIYSTESEGAAVTCHCLPSCCSSKVSVSRPGLGSDMSTDGVSAGAAATDPTSAARENSEPEMKSADPPDTSSTKSRLKYEVDERVDARDFEGHWYPGTIVEVQRESTQDVGAGAATGDSETSSGSGRVQVSFDAFGDKYNEWYKIGDTKLRVIYSKTRRPAQVMKTMTLLHRVSQKSQTSEAAGTSAAGGAPATSHRYIGTPRVLCFSSYLASSDLFDVIDAQVRHLTKKSGESDANTGSQPSYKVLVVKLHTGAARVLRRTSAPPTVKKGEVIVLEWGSIDFYDETCDAIEEHPSVAEVMDNRTHDIDQDSRGLTLEKCLRSYGEVDNVGEDYRCDKCEQRGTTKSRVQLVRLPDIMVIHVKRFVYTMYVRGKLTNLVQYPLEGLDMKPYLAAGSSDGDNEIYDLFGVVNHIGGMNGGHYTAMCRVGANDDVGSTAGDWYDFNDMHVTPLDAARVVSSSGYLLFYRRREMSPHNIINLAY